MVKKRLHLIFVLYVVIGLGAAVAYYILSHAERNPSESSIVAPNFGGPFTLTDHTGKKVTEKDFEGTARLIYFGFIFCPAICPTELAKISKVLDLLGDKSNQITPIFITIDPNRDTQKVMADYVTLFHPRLIGLTGTPEQIAQAAKGYKVYYAKVDDPSLSDYTMDHSSYIYFIDTEGTLRGLYKTHDSAGEIAADIQKSLD